MGYPWFWAKLSISQTAEWIGFYGLSLMTMIYNASFANTLKTNAKKFQILMTFVFIGFMGLGDILKLNLPEPDSKLKMLLVQANIGNFEKYAAERNSDFRLPIITKHFELTNLGMAQFPDSDVIFWPETAFPANLHPQQSTAYYPMLLKNYIQQKQKPLITGGYLDELDGRYYNYLFYLNKEGNITSSVSKSILLAFGEYFPGSNYFPFLKTLVPAVSDFGRGPGPGVLQHGDIKLGAQICYEGLFDEYSRELAHLGSQIILNVTNDSWFGHKFESQQHLYMTLARAIEMRRPLVRVTNTGISAAVTAAGEVLVESPQETEWYGQVTVPYYSNGPKTFYSGFGYLLTWLAAGFICVLGISLRNRSH
jgi:apolipoprotein N-acyltransferase